MEHAAADVRRDSTLPASHRNHHSTARTPILGPGERGPFAGLTSAGRIHLHVASTSLSSMTGLIHLGAAPDLRCVIAAFFASRRSVPNLRRKRKFLRNYRISGDHPSSPSNRSSSTRNEGSNGAKRVRPRASIATLIEASSEP